MAYLSNRLGVPSFFVQDASARDQEIFDQSRPADRYPQGRLRDLEIARSPTASGKNYQIKSEA
jgi:hypothetical protein